MYSHCSSWCAYTELLPCQSPTAEQCSQTHAGVACNAHWSYPFGQPPAYLPLLPPTPASFRHFPLTPAHPLTHPSPHPLPTQPVTKEEFGKIFGPASMHAIGHVAANVSFAAVAISLTHTVKTLEPAFNVILSQLILGQATPLPVVLSLVPIMVGAR